MANRKLQTEIDRTLKKVTEGLEIFHETLEKLDSVTSQAQKEKIEVELKKEIKKLQRLRDLIKTWQTMSELKDKQAINEARRLIELEMERFKVLEKEMKIKAYSKEGLSQAAKLDPREQEKLKVSHWINSAVDKLGTQTDALEAELETLQIAARKSKRLDGGRQERLDALPEMIERNKGHIKKLEQLLRFMENDKFSPEEVNEIKDDVEYYLDANQEPDFIPDESLYDQFNLVDGEDEEGDEISENESDLDSSVDDESLSIQQKSSKDSISTTPANSPSSGLKKRSSSVNLGTTPVSGSSSVTGIGVGGSVSGGGSGINLPSSIQNASSTLPIGGGINLPQIQIKKDKPAITTVKESLPKPIPTVPLIVHPQVNVSAPSTPAVVPKVSGPSFASAIAGSTPSAASKSSTVAPSSTIPSLVSRPLSPMLQPSTSFLKSHKFGSLSLPGPYEELFAVIQRRKAQNKNQQKPSLPEFLSLVESSYLNCPDGSEMERSKLFTPKQPFTVPSYYPIQPPSILENPAIFERFELDTLFFIFYYQQKTHAQYLAARELKRQSWRFHKKYLTWFQRHEEPKTITEDYEQGTYIYFDYEGNWCQRKKSEFTFEYRFLEDEETV